MNKRIKEWNNERYKSNRRYKNRKHPRYWQIFRDRFNIRRFHRTTVQLAAHHREKLYRSSNKKLISTTKGARFALHRKLGRKQPSERREGMRLERESKETSRLESHFMLIETWKALQCRLHYATRLCQIS